MRGNRQALVTWLVPDGEMPAVIYLDASIYREFTQWLVDKGRSHPELLTKIQDGIYQIVVFREQLNRLFGKDLTRDSLLHDKMGFEVVKASGPSKISSLDQSFVDELLRAYFNNRATALHHAQFLLLTRRHSGGNWINVITQHEAFGRIPMVNSWFVEGYEIQDTEELELRDYFRDLGIHPAIRQAAEERLRNSDPASAILESTKQVFEKLRQITGIDDDGMRLVNEALGCKEFWPRCHHQKVPNDLPQITLNRFEPGSEWNEQKGYWQLASGMTAAFRNPTAHEPADSLFIKERFSDERSVMKVICLISLIMEKLEQSYVRD